MGNLIVKKSVNDLPLDLKNLVTITDDQIITSDVIIDANLIADKLSLSNINSKNLMFIMEDVVRHSVPQVSFYFENKTLNLCLQILSENC